MKIIIVIIADRNWIGAKQMIDEKKLIEEIRSCTTRSELDGMREKVVEFWNQSKNISSYKLVRSEFIKAKDRIRRNGEGWYK